MVDYCKKNNDLRKIQISKENLDEVNKANEIRSQLNHKVIEFVHILQTHSFSIIDKFLEPKSVLNIHNNEIIGRINIQEFLEKEYQNTEMKLLPIRTLIDVNQYHVACEFFTRKRAMGSNDEYDEKMASWYLKFSEDFEIKTWYIWIDLTYNRKEKDLNAPVPDEGWRPKATQEITFSEMENVVESQITLFNENTIDEWSHILHDEIIIRPPWKVTVGKEGCIRGAKEYFVNHTNTKVCVLDFLHDEEHPNWGVLIQIFKSTNRESNFTGEDMNYIFVEIIDGKFRYYKCYYNSNSLCAYENSFKYFIQSVKNANDPR